MTVYVVDDGLVLIFIDTPVGMGDGVTSTDDPDLPAWVAAAANGIYDEQGKPVAEWQAPS
jgi:hypothetical protein